MKKIDSILIANRGEIASRVIRTCRLMGIRSVAVYSTADTHAPFVKEADSAVFIGDNNPNESYLDQNKIIDAAKRAQADAIHPGYGFLSENSAFAQLCNKNNIIFIGPNAKAIELMGSKSKAKSLMAKHNVPIIPGYQGKDQSNDKLKKEAEKIGFPVLLKATAGGGGKGMRVVNNKKELDNAIAAAKREAMNAFGDDEMIVEKYIASGRHIEFQIFGDQHDNAIHLLERECTIQRRHQKVIEESPSPIMSDKLRKKMGESAVSAAKALNYDNAGTVEFIYDEASGDYYFLEVNTRLQVEHPVTEEVTGLDLVQMQIESAQGMPLKQQQKDINGNGYAIEARLYAEDPSNDFLPVTGTIYQFDSPKINGLRVETSIESGSAITIHYDPMIAKIIVHDKDRESAQRKLKYVLRNMNCLGITTNQDFLLNICNNTDFEKGNYNTHFIEENPALINENKDNEKLNLATLAATLFDWQDRDAKRTLLNAVPTGWRNNFYSPQAEKFLYKEEAIKATYRSNKIGFEFNINNSSYNAKIINNSESHIQIEANGIQHEFTIIKSGAVFYINNEITGNITLHQQDRFPEVKKEKQKGTYESPMPSQVIKLLVKEGDQIKSGEGLIVLSSMKMENTILADEDGTVEEVFAMEGENIEAGHLLMKIKSQNGSL